MGDLHEYELALNECVIFYFRIVIGILYVDPNNVLSYFKKPNMSRDNSPTPKSSKYFFRPKREGDIAYLTERIHEIVHECQIVWLNILSEIRPNRDTEDDTDLEPAEITERLNKTGKFSHYFFIDNG